MKNKIISIAALIIAMTLVSGNAMAAMPFSQLDDREDVDVVYVSKGLLGAFNSKSTLGALSRHVPVSFDDFERLYVISSSSPAGVAACREAMKQYLASHEGMELLMSAKEGSDITKMYGIPSDNPGRYKVLMVYTLSDGDDVTIVYIEGGFTIHSD